MSNIQQKPDQATALPDPVLVPAPTNPRKPARGKPQLKFFRGRFWDVYPNGDVIPARDEDEPEEEVVQLAVSTSTVPPQSAPTCTPSQPPAPSYPTTDITTQVARGETVTVPASISPQLPARLQHLPPQPLKLKQDTIQPATPAIKETHSRRKNMQQPVGIEARPVKKRMIYHHPFNSFVMSSRDEPINLRTAPSGPTAPAATPLTYEQTARDHARPASRGGTSMTDRRPRNHTLGEPVEGETWPDAPTIGVSNFKLARSMPRRPPKKGLVRLNGSKPRICDNAGCSAYHSHKDCTMPSQCKGCGSPKHFWGGCKCSCNICGAQQHTAELCFTIPVGEDRKQRSGNPDGYRQGFYCGPQSRELGFEDRDPLGQSGGRLPGSDDRDTSRQFEDRIPRRRPEDSIPRPEKRGPGAQSERGNSAYEDKAPSEWSSGRTPGHDHRRREGRWGQERTYLEPDEGHGHLGRYEVSGRKRSADTTGDRSAKSAPSKRMRIKEEDEA